MEELSVTEAEAGQRIDQWLALQMPLGISRGNVQTMIAEGHVKLNGQPVSKANKKVVAGDIVAWVMPPAKDPEPEAENIALDILYEDDDLIVINKPAGLVVHPGPGNETGTLVNALLHHCGDTLSGIGGVKRPGIVHRLDKDTSGVMVVAKNDFAHKHLSDQFADHGRTNDMQRSYMALLWGNLPRARDTVATHLGRSSSDRRKQSVVSESQPDARHAVTHYRLMETFGPPENAIACLAECTLETGRTHQIRVHMAHIGHPLIGDDVYGSGFKTKIAKLPEDTQKAIKDLNRQALHAWLLAFEHPRSGEMLEFKSAMPDDIARVANALRQETALRQDATS